jgi:signal transduction histidine kinase
VVRSKSGEDIPIELSASLIYADSQEIGVVGFFRDLRERKQMQEKLLQAERLAALGQMAAHISHEIKNPLMIIGGFTRQVRDSLEAEPAKNMEKLQIILDEVRRLEDFLSEIGRYTRLSQPARQPGDLNGLVLDILHKLEPTFTEKKIQVVQEFSASLPAAAFDPELMRQAVLNVAKNAIEAMPDGGSLTVASGVEDGRIWVRLSDSGSGIPAEHLAKIFHPFYTTKARGSGLGLTIVQKIMEAHQGGILLESEPEHGTRVTLFLQQGETAE